MTGRKAIAEIFSAQGVQYVFGNPGTTELGLIDILQDYTQIEYMLCLHEGIALGMAHMYANASGKTGVVNLHVAPGLGNALGALYNAVVGKVPLVVTAGQQDSRMLVREPILSYDLVAMARPLTKWAVQIQHVEEAPVIVSRAFKVAHDPPRGPVFISLPGNIMDQDADLDLPGRNVSYRRTRPDPQGVAAATELLSKAERPVIICGDGVSASQAQKQLVEIAEYLGAQVWNTVLMGALNFPTSHPQFRGELPGEHTLIRKALGDADVVLAVGADIFGEIFYAKGSPLPEGCALVHLTDSPWEIGKNLPTDIGLLADLKLALQEISQLLVPKMAGAAQHHAKERRAAMLLQKEREHERQGRRAQEKWDISPIAPARLMATLRDCLPGDVVLYNEAITATADLLRTIQFRRPGSLFGNQGGGIGQGLPGALGVKLANPDRPVVALVGDGSAMYSVQSFWTAAHHHIPVIYIILNNQSYRILKFNMNRYRRTQHLSAIREYPLMNLVDPPLDFIKIAFGMGVAGKRIIHPEEIEPAVTEALALGGPYVLEVMIEGSVPGE